MELEGPCPSVGDKDRKPWTIIGEEVGRLFPAERERFAATVPDARLVTHYRRHAAFLGEDQRLHHADLPNGIPGAVIHGRYDVNSPLKTSRQFSRRRITSYLHVLEDADHGGASLLNAIADAFTEATAS